MAVAISGRVWRSLIRRCCSTMWGRERGRRRRSRGNKNSYSFTLPLLFLVVPTSSSTDKEGSLTSSSSSPISSHENISSPPPSFFLPYPLFLVLWGGERMLACVCAQDFSLFLFPLSPFLKAFKNEEMDTLRLQLWSFREGKSHHIFLGRKGKRRRG